ncbi:hypothetical protein, partial [Kocuria rosea]|uniref:hypothetical protein n=1 Tax=Kocuria rosea TaxID=1275 RepID=UPI001C92DF46
GLMSVRSGSGGMRATVAGVGLWLWMGGGKGGEGGLLRVVVGGVMVVVMGLVLKLEEGCGVWGGEREGEVE